MARQAVKGTDRPRAQWYWNSSYDPWSTSGKEEWTKYSDIQSEIIEEAFNGKSKTELAELDNYWINLKDSVQISKSDQNKQRPIQRVLIKRNENEGLREQRFFLPHPLKPFNHNHRSNAYTFLSLWKKGKQLSNAEIVEQAAVGIILEGKQLDEHRESQWIAEKLTAVKNKNRQEIYNCCIMLYTMECFLYKLINKALRENDRSKEKTLGPFCYILFRSWFLDANNYRQQLYRGVNTDENMVKSYNEATGETRCWDSFTSTSKSRKKAESFGNTLFTIDATNNTGIDIAPSSRYPDEEEVLLPPGTVFQIIKVKPAPETGKTYIDLKLKHDTDDDDDDTDGHPSPAASSLIVFLWSFCSLWLRCGVERIVRGGEAEDLLER
ncbi:unnamed protein product [Didymodactylos carnosus]|uniref:NAD(P)(+)--arginine ADP-ribosyltransferase n=1 Tax=Didymodactylos carnosus TaxID=1234261 RepID=A0A8S2K6Z7_9BILA|nr:unnamed protein product [Didymodactylos carnosus]CAF3838196.1 unnamed protein product [Didymodactylos carnosus]